MRHADSVVKGVMRAGSTALTVATDDEGGGDGGGGEATMVVRNRRASSLVTRNASEGNQFATMCTFNSSSSLVLWDV